MTSSDKKVALLTYGRVISKHFVPWMACTWTTCVSPSAREACHENLFCEVKDDHPRMLYRLVSQIKTPVGDDNVPYMVDLRADRADRVANDIWDLVKKSPVNGLLVMAALENASLIFIPWLTQLAYDLKIKDQTYLKVHGEADIEHARVFLRVLADEIKKDLCGECAWSTTLEITQELLSVIFTGCIRQMS